MSNTAALYQQYIETTQRAADFNNAAAVLGWDQEVNMPPKGFDFRGKQLATLATAAHELTTSEQYGALLQELAGRQDLTETQLRNVVLSLEDYQKNQKLPATFIDAITRQTSASYQAWIQARRDNDYAVYAPELAKMIALKKEQADRYGYGQHPYDALLDDYEKGATVQMLDGVFHQVKEQLPPLLQQIKHAPQVNDDFFYRHYPKEKQFAFTLDVLREMGYDFEAGRQDYAEHPFSTSFAPTDVRVTTRVDEQNLASIIWSSIHEGGHALYEQGLPESEYGLPLGAAVSLSIHESQSRLWENCVGRSQAFWTHFYPQLQSYFPGTLNDVSVQDFYKGMNKVEPSFIRTEADEITYHFHVLIRYEIEKALLDGSLAPQDLAALWNERYHHYLGITPPDDKQGVLQDVHWSHGSFGYFPTYSLGSFYAAQFFEQASQEFSGLEADIRQGLYTRLLHWLRKKVHRHGRRFDSETLCRQITGRPLDFGSFMNYARAKYSGIYGF